MKQIITNCSFHISVGTSYIISLKVVDGRPRTERQWCQCLGRPSAVSLMPWEGLLQLMLDSVCRGCTGSLAHSDCHHQLGTLQAHTWVTWRCSGRALDLWSRGRRFNARPRTARQQLLGKVVNTHVPLFTKQYNLVPCEGFMLTRHHVAAIHGSNEQGKYCSSGFTAFSTLLFYFTHTYGHISAVIFQQYLGNAGSTRSVV